jgi:microcystin-dependent protein
MSQLSAVANVAVPTVPVGSLQAYAGANAPYGWLLCDGSAVSRTSYPDLYSALGTAYGAGDGSTTFNIPDMRGRHPIGAGAGVGTATSGSGTVSGGTLTTRTRGQWGGEENHLNTSAESGLPSHNHTASQASHSHNVTDPGFTPSVNNISVGAGGIGYYGRSFGAQALFTDSQQPAVTVGSVTAANASSSHNTMHPFVVTNYIIKALSDVPRNGLYANPAVPIVTSLPTNPAFGDQVILLQTIASTTYKTQKIYDGTSWVSSGPDPVVTWTAPTLLNGWGNYGGGYQTARYTRDSTGTVFIEGLVNAGSGIIFTLPTGYRPATAIIFTTIANNTASRLDIDAGGNVSWNSGGGGTNGFVSLVCSFKASA